MSKTYMRMDALLGYSCRYAAQQGWPCLAACIGKQTFYLSLFALHLTWETNGVVQATPPRPHKHHRHRHMRAQKFARDKSHIRTQTHTTDTHARTHSHTHTTDARTHPPRVRKLTHRHGAHAHAHTLSRTAEYSRHVVALLMPRPCRSDAPTGSGPLGV